jgi:HEAT repeat protein
MSLRFFRQVVVVGVLFLSAAPAAAYVDLAPTLGRIVRESQTITLAEVERFNPEKGAVLLKKVRDLKGESDAAAIKHKLLREGEASIDRPLREWAEPGGRCVIFVSGKAAVVCVGEAWYQITAADGGWWTIGPRRPDLPLAYYGMLSRLTDAVSVIAEGKTAVITALPHGSEKEGASFDLALNRANLPGLVKVQRLRASLRMPDVAFAVGSNPALVVGLGRAGVEDLAALRANLRSEDAGVRAESAADLGSLGSSAAAAADDLARLLDDPAPRVRLAAASALLRVKKSPKALEVLAKGLTGDDAAARRYAARAAGLAGAEAAPLAGDLGALLKDADPLVRRTALQALATLGPPAAKALDAVTPLLADTETAADAAEALGRMGPAARPAMPELAKLLESKESGERWAAVRAMAQIGGEGAAPAVKYIVKELPGASEIDGYNMLVCLSLLGPVAKDAIPAVMRSRVRNPILKQTTAWAINPAGELPWNNPFGGADFSSLIIEAYVQEVGDNLRPAAVALAKKIMDGKAGDVPPWGYRLLGRHAEAALAVLTPALGEKELARRERAAVALGYMGRAAAEAKPQVAKALAAAENEKEQRLLKWCLRELEK